MICYQTIKSNAQLVSLLRGSLIIRALLINWLLINPLMNSQMNGLLGSGTKLEEMAYQVYTWKGTHYFWPLCLSPPWLVKKTSSTFLSTMMFLLCHSPKINPRTKVKHSSFKYFQLFAHTNREMINTEGEGKHISNFPLRVRPREHTYYLWPILPPEYNLMASCMARKCLETRVL